MDIRIISTHFNYIDVTTVSDKEQVFICDSITVLFVLQIGTIKLSGEYNTSDIKSEEQLKEEIGKYILKQIDK